MRRIIQRKSSIALTLVLAVTGSLFKPTRVWAHGEDKPGPHGGVIRMPGAFHTEVMADGKGGVRVYVLDIGFKNPTTDNAAIKAAVIKQGETRTELSCKAENEYFTCSGTGPLKLDTGELVLEASRDGAAALPAIYPLPLTHSKAERGH